MIKKTGKKGVGKLSDSTKSSGKGAKQGHPLSATVGKVGETSDGLSQRGTWIEMGAFSPSLGVAEGNRQQGEKVGVTSHAPERKKSSWSRSRGFQPRAIRDCARKSVVSRCRTEKSRARARLTKKPLWQSKGDAENRGKGRPLFGMAQAL